MLPESLPPAAYLVDVRWGLAYPLHRVVTGIGRDMANPILVRDLAASRTHAEVRRTDNAYVLQPIATAETKVNGIALTGPRPLADGDVVEVAYTRLRFTHKPPTGDVLPAPAHAAMDPDLAGQKTQIREIVSPEKLQEVRRRLMRPVELHWWVLVAAALAAALALASLILLATRVWPG
ncbi:MAG: FHA domain-containing protein [Gemmatimonadaceae bacterium]|nr:FHA domain-containing protein [Gemmatimonadaceae bacterium]